MMEKNQEEKGATQYKMDKSNRKKETGESTELKQKVTVILLRANLSSICSQFTKSTTCLLEVADFDRVKLFPSSNLSIKPRFVLYH